MSAFIRGARVANTQNTSINQTMTDARYRAEDVAMAARKEQAKDFANTVANNSAAVQTAMDAKRVKAETEIGIEKDKRLASNKNKVRMTGKLAGGAAMIGAAHFYGKKKHEKDAQLGILETNIAGLDSKLTDADTKIAEAQAEVERLKGLSPTTNDSNADSTTVETPGVSAKKVAPGSASSGGDRRAFDITGRYESDAYGGYNAYNLGGSNQGRTAHGSGNSATSNVLGGALTSMTIGQIKDLQSRGKLHAAGRYQFIGNSLPEAAQFAGFDDNTVFTPDNQDRMFMAFGNRYGSGRWVGLEKATPEERAIVDSAFASWKP